MQVIAAHQCLSRRSLMHRCGGFGYGCARQGEAPRVLASLGWMLSSPPRSGCDVAAYGECNWLKTTFPARVGVIRT